MPLPGGLWEEGRRERAYAFRAFDGHWELAMDEALARADSVPAAITAVLAQSLAHIGGRPATAKRVAALCVPDRRYLMRRLQAALAEEPLWHTARCDACQAPFDYPLRLSSLPVSEAGEGYPHAEVEQDGGRWLLRLPTGADQEAVVGIDALPEARKVLLQRLMVDGPREALPERIDDETWQRVETALEAVAPQLIEQVQARCPECGAENVVTPEPYPLLQRRFDGLLREIHRIAGFYHWPEPAILDLPRRRRRQYLRLIDEAQGLQQ